MTRVFHLDDADYARFRDLIKDRTGMVIGDNRRNALARALKESAERAQCTDSGQLLAHLESCKTEGELWDDLIKKLTIGETYFFRHREQIEALRRNILPDLIARHWNDRTLRLWSAGCATGEEPYTLAILLRQLIPDIERWKIRVLGTDINRQALSRAALGHFRDWSFRGTDGPEQAFRARHFKREHDEFTLDPSIREMVTFSYLNLVEDAYPSPRTQTSPVDLILFRNVSIYLPHHVTREIADRFYECLSPGGWLMVGPSETHLEIYRKFQMLVFHGSIVYQKVEGLSASGRPTAKAPGPFGPDRPVSVSGHRLLTPYAPERPPAPSNSGNPAQSPVSDRVDRTIPAAAFPLAEKVFPSPPVARSPRQETPGDGDLYEKGEALFKQRRYDEARQSFLECLKGEPASFLARYRLACLEANAGRLEEARAWAESALRDNPLKSEIHYILAVINVGQESWDEAIGRLRKAIYLDPDFALAHFSLFNLYGRLGKKQEAERHRVLAIRLASALPPDMVLPGSDDLSAAELLGMARVSPQPSDTSRRGTT